MNIHDPWTQLCIFSASESQGKSATFLHVCFPVPSVYRDNQELQPSV